MNTIIHFVRHGEVNNPEKIAYGRMPGFHLSKNGAKEAEKLGEYFRQKQISSIFTSPLERAFETANIISEHLKKHLEVIHKYELIEINAKKWQSFPLEELFQNKYFESFINRPFSTEVPENLDKLANRMEKFAIEVCNRHKEEEVICVSHEYPIVSLRLKLEGRPLTDSKKIDIETGSITTFVFDDICKLHELSYTELQ